MIEQMNEISLLTELVDDKQQGSAARMVFEAERYVSIPGPHAVFWSREAALDGRQKQRCSSSSNTMSDGSSSFSSHSSAIRDLYRNSRSYTCSNKSSCSSCCSNSRSSGAKSSASSFSYDLEAEMDTEALIEELASFDPAGVQPYSTPLLITDLSGAVEPLHVLRNVLRDMRSRELITQHAALHTRLRKQLVRRERAALLQILNRIQLFDVDSIEYMRGCRRAATAHTMMVQRVAYPVERVLYWICSNSTNPNLSKIGGRFMLETQCGTPQCVNPQHYSYSFKRHGNVLAEERFLESLPDEKAALKAEQAEADAENDVLIVGV